MEMSVLRIFFCCLLALDKAYDLYFQNTTEWSLPSASSNYTIPEVESTEEGEEVNVSDIPATTKEPYRPHK
uniref:Secreted protein n=1 Tax=Steinernema glaseri TaxID=37863 RepID=A0A1I7ZEV1_9BILA